MFSLGEPSIYLAAQALAGLICKWRHRSEWQGRGGRVFPAQRYIVTANYCPRCGGEVLTYSRLTDEEAETWWKLIVNPKPGDVSRSASLK